MNFRTEMEEMYLQDLTNATEIVLDVNRRCAPAGEPLHRHPMMTSAAGERTCGKRGAVRIGHAVGAAFTGRRVLGPVEAALDDKCRRIFF